MRAVAASEENERRVQSNKSKKESRVVMRLIGLHLVCLEGKEQKKKKSRSSQQLASVFHLNGTGIEEQNLNTVRNKVNQHAKSKTSRVGCRVGIE